MNRSKIVVLIILVLIAIGVTAWSWVNFVHTPEYDPEKAHLYLEHFYHRCTVEYPEQICDDAVGAYHRSCFVDHLELTPEDEVDEKGPVIYDLRAYLECMESSIDNGD